MHIKRTGETYPGKHTPIVPKPLFDRVQGILKGKLFSRPYKHDYLFRRMVRCAGCGRRLIGERHKQFHIYHRCHSDIGRTSVREDELDHAVQMTLKGLICASALSLITEHLIEEAIDHAASVVGVAARHL